jgi:hypothetical protein
VWATLLDEGRYLASERTMYRLLAAPATVHHGHAHQAHAERAHVLEAAYARTPERFVRQAPTPPPVPTAGWINRPNTDEAAH